MITRRRNLAVLDDTEFWLTNEPTIPEMRQSLKDGMVTLLPILNACITAGFDIDNSTNMTVKISTYECADHVGTVFWAKIDGENAALFWGDPCITTELVVVLKRSDGVLVIRSPLAGVADEVVDGNLYEYLVRRDYNANDLCYAPWRTSADYQDGSVVLCRRKSRETGKWQYSLFTDWRKGNENEECQYLLVQRSGVSS